MSRDVDDESSQSDVTRQPYTLFARIHLCHSSLPLVPALERAPETEVRPRSLTPGTERLFFAGVGDDLAAFEAALGDDPTVAKPVLIREVEDQRVYRVTLTDHGRSKLYPLDTADAYLHTAVGTGDGWTLRLELPDRDGLVRFTRECRDAGIEFEIERIEGTHDIEDHHDYGLSSEQANIIRTAYDTGYFEVPRGVSQTDLAESLDLSTSAVSQQLRRATAELVANTLMPRRDP